ncbi:penicillin acylase family protein [Williamsia herbipolensis]|uniref:penicillin acylase family protein n=1 Tax=Williamsia herbipolensis TaxID=1603258 RepID=UPI0005F88C80|nr:penicillin acylase family protein [Williamsia herbipolensis]
MTAPCDAQGVEILRDAWGIPHIRADSARGALYGQGQACGMDRAWQIEFLRLRSEGRTAEVFGADAIGWDEFARRAGIDRAARTILARSSVRTRELFGAYVDGVNSTLATAEALELTELDHRPLPWRPWTPIAVFITHNILFGRFLTKLWRVHACTHLGTDALRLFDFESPAAPDPDDPFDPPLPDAAFVETVLAEFAAGAIGTEPPGPTPLSDAISGSNAWGIAAARSASGTPQIAGDPHRFLELPGIYLQTHLASPEFDVVGFAFAGVPGVPHFAHAGPVAWGITNAMGDHQDVYIEHLSRRDGSVTARGPHGDVAVTTWTESITVRDAEPVPVEIIETTHGSVIVGGPDAPIALSLRTPILHHDTTTADPFIDLLFATSIAGVERALRDWVEPVNRVVIGDTSGRLVAHLVGAMPERTPENYWLPVPGWTDRHRWTGMRTTSVHDGAESPDVTSFSVIANQRMTTAPLQPVTTECVRADRADRIAALLEAKAHHSVADAERIHRDDVLDARDIVLRLVDEIDGLDERARRLVARLDGWDRSMAVDSTQAYVFAEIRAHLVRGLIRSPALQPLATRHVFPAVFDPWFVSLPRVSAALESVIAHAGGLGADVGAILREAVDAVASGLEHLDDIPTWGDVHVLTPIHGFDLVGATTAHPALSARLRPHPHALGGDAETVFANGSAIGFSHACSVGSAARFVWDLADRSASRWVVPLGASGDPRHPTYENQSHRWARGDLYPVVDSWDRLSTITALGDDTTATTDHLMMEDA